MRIALVHGSNGNAFMREILEAIAFEARELGVSAEVYNNVVPPDDGETAYVVIPHEYFAVVEPKSWLSTSQLARTIALTVEHPGTTSFDLSAQQARRCAAIFDINKAAARQLTHSGAPAKHLQLGYTPAWDVWRGQVGSERSRDLVYLGAQDARRDLVLSSCAPGWWDLQCDLRVSTSEPRTDSTPAFLVGKAKHQFLADSKVLVNIHRSASSALEWVRVIEAVSNGALVLSEHSEDAAPLAPRRHFISVQPSALGVTGRALVRNTSLRREVRDEAYEFLTQKLRLSHSVAALLECAERLVDVPSPQPQLAEIPIPAHYETRSRPVPWERKVDEIDHLGSAVIRLEQRLKSLQQKISLMDLGEPSIRAAEREVLRTPAYAGCNPKISVVIPVHNQGRFLAEALSGIEASVGVEVEVVVFDDASTDDSLSIASDLLQERAWLPARLMSGRVNQGLAAARNSLVRSSRGDYIFSLDSDNGIFPTALRRLAEALDDHPEASFAYSPIVALRGGRPAGLVSAKPWDPRELRYGNYIDNMSLIRRSALERVGGWAEYMRIWEDFHLWARMAEAGMAPIQVPTVLAWYRTSNHSMRMEAGVDEHTIWSRLREDAPTLFADEAPLTSPA